MRADVAHMEMHCSSNVKEAMQLNSQNQHFKRVSPRKALRTLRDQAKTTTFRTTHRFAMSLRAAAAFRGDDSAAFRDHGQKQRLKLPCSSYRQKAPAVTEVTSRLFISYEAYLRLVCSS